MKVDHIQRSHIEEASAFIDQNGIPKQYQRNIYWVTVNGKEYPFKYLVRIAHQLTEGNKGKWLDFQSKSEYRDYVSLLGYTIRNSTTQQIPFFTPEDIQLLSDNAGMTYDLSNEHQKIAEDLKNGVWEKTKFWFNEVLKELDGFTGECKKIWSKRAWEEGERVSAFKDYTWARIYKEGDEEKDIYFTVGVDGNEEALVYKLDYQFEGPTKLTYEQKVICEAIIKSSPARWQQISMDDLSDYNWEKLIEETVSFIEQYQELYSEAVEEAWSVNQKRVCRITWNDRGWVEPSGFFGKSEHENSHEKRFGFGHEEWLFDTSKIIDGYHYGFLEPIRKKQETYKNRIFDVWLYTIDGASKKRYWIGDIKNLEVIDEEEASRIKEEYKSKGWLKEMEAQIVAAGGNPDNFLLSEGINIFNIRFKPEDLKENYFLLPKDHPIYNVSRYNFGYFKSEFD